jgi:DNA-binding YbaB/EbfC family protein
MLKGLGQIASFMKHAQEIQGRMKDLQESLRRLKIEGTAGGGMVAVEMNGQQQVLSCRIEKSLNQALEKVKQAAADEMSKIAGGMDLPGLSETLSQLGQAGK